MIPSADAEAWLAKRLGEHGFNEGLTTVELRRERLREAIYKIGPLVIVGRNPKTGKAETYAQAFERLYGVPFDELNTLTSQPLKTPSPP